ncbi:glycerate kinase [Pseudonocardia sp. WMMC193]|uniref:glycerate kinase family protein n=1 Tax=Pseudonocardia sp. WMMC193 TaxID=2911965 RepID=UPI001F4807B5|nr:glycerate kinase [Pseudonocardia sp. WMMC193]MCF7548143.1 glycerate kinase [Pseudonocardia sp. WMMC193]
MRVVVAPDSFGGTLSAPAAAAAIAEGWRRAVPDAVVDLVPLADGGTGFVDVLHAGLGGTLHEPQVTGPFGEPVTAPWLQVGQTAYVESAAACGLHHVPRAQRTPEVAGSVTTYGVGELLLRAVEAGCTEAVIGLGGSATTDGGAGMYAALGLGPLDAEGAPLPPGGRALGRAARLAEPPGSPLAGLRLVAASDVDNPLLGPHGAAAVFGPQKGADAATVEALDAALAHWADLLPREVRDEPAAGAAGGLGAALLALGARVESGAGLVRALLGLDPALDAVAAGGGVAITGEGSFDWQSLRGKLITAVASAAAERGVPCVVVAGQVAVGRREAAAAGVDAAYAVAEHAGGVEASMADPAGTLAALAEHVARRWGA